MVTTLSIITTFYRAARRWEKSKNKICKNRERAPEENNNVLPSNLVEEQTKFFGKQFRKIKSKTIQSPAAPSSTDPGPASPSLSSSG